MASCAQSGAISLLSIPAEIRQYILAEVLESHNSFMLFLDDEDIDHSERIRSELVGWASPSRARQFLNSSKRPSRNHAAILATCKLLFQEGIGLQYQNNFNVVFEQSVFSSRSNVAAAHSIVKVDRLMRGIPPHAPDHLTNITLHHFIGWNDPGFLPDHVGRVLSHAMLALHELPVLRKLKIEITCGPDSWKELDRGNMQYLPHYAQRQSFGSGAEYQPREEYVAHMRKCTLMSKTLSQILRSAEMAPMVKRFGGIACLQMHVQRMLTATSVEQLKDYETFTEGVMSAFRSEGDLPAVEEEREGFLRLETNIGNCGELFVESGKSP